MKVKILDNSINRGWNKGDVVEVSEEQAHVWSGQIELLEGPISSTPTIVEVVLPVKPKRGGKKK